MVSIMQSQLQVTYDRRPNKFPQLIENWIASKKSIEELEAAMRLLTELDIDSTASKRTFQYYANYAGPTQACQFFERLSLGWKKRNQSEADLDPEIRFLEELKNFDKNNCMSDELSSTKYQKSTDTNNRQSIVEIHSSTKEALRKVTAKYHSKIAAQKDEQARLAQEEEREKRQLLVEIAYIKTKIDDLKNTLTTEISKAWFGRGVKKTKKDALDKLSGTLSVSETSSLSAIKKAVAEYKNELYRCEGNKVLRQGVTSKRSDSLIDSLSKDLENENHAFNKAR